MTKKNLLEMLAGLSDEAEIYFFVYDYDCENGTYARDMFITEKVIDPKLTEEITFQILI